MTLDGGIESISPRIKICFAMILFEHYDEVGPILKQVRSVMATSFISPSDLSKSTLRQLHMVGYFSLFLFVYICIHTYTGS